MFSAAGSDEPDELLRRCGLETDEALQGIGIYMTDKSLVRAADENGEHLGLLIRAVLGRVAFGDRVQRPEQTAVDAAFEDLTDQYIDEEFERRRRDLGQ